MAHLSSSKRSKTQWFRSPIFFLANLALLLVVGVSTVRETYRGWTVDREIHALDAEAAALEGHKLELQNLTQSLSSPERVEYDARAKLGRKKVDERVIVLEGITPTTTWVVEPSSAPDPVSHLSLDTHTSNPNQWWHYFFH